MKITILASISATPKVKEIRDNLKEMGHEVEIPWMSQRIIDGKNSIEDFLKEKEKNGDIAFRNQAEEDLIKRYYKKIKDSDAVFVINIDKDKTKNYIGGNVLIEIAFAYILDKYIFLLNPIPDLNYKDEIIAMKSIIVKGDLNKIKEYAQS